MKRCADDDIVAFGSFVAAGRLPQTTEAERAARDTARRVALLASIQAPLVCARSAISLLDVAFEAYPVIAPVVLSDFGTALVHTRASLWSLMLNIETNRWSLQELPPVAEIGGGVEGGIGTDGGRKREEQLEAQYAEVTVRIDQAEQWLGSILHDVQRKIRNERPAGAGSEGFK